MSRPNDFSEKIIEEVKKKAMFRCCRCQDISVEVHHILPIKDGGDNSMENAAPLCPSCHSLFGDNPIKRKEIKQMRNNWYETVEKMYGPKADILVPLIGKVNASLEDIKKEQSKKPNLDEVKTLLKEVVNTAIDNMNMGTVGATASNMVTASGVSLSNVRLEDIAQFVHCSECGSDVFVKPHENSCPKCGAYLYS